MINWPSENDPTKADSTPAYDGIGWGDYWTASDWVSWHKAMKAKWGIEEANRRFIEAWEGGGYFDSPPYDARSFDSDFKSYAQANGFYDALFGKGLGFLAKPVSGAVTVTNDVTKAVTNTSSVLVYLVPVAAVVLIFFWVKNHTKK